MGGRTDGSGLERAGKACRRMGRPSQRPDEMRFRRRAGSIRLRRAREAWRSTCSGRPRRAQPQCGRCCGSGRARMLGTARSSQETCAFRCRTRGFGTGPPVAMNVANSVQAKTWPRRPPRRVGRGVHRPRSRCWFRGEGPGGRAGCPNAVQPENTNRQRVFLMAPGRGWQGPSRKGHSRHRSAVASLSSD